MVINLRKVFDFIRFLIMFTLFTFIFYHILSWVFGFIKPQYQFKKPAGNSIEVSTQVKSDTPIDHLREKLFHFWINGE